MGARLLIVTLLLLSLFLPANAQCALATARSEAPENQKKWDPTGEWAAKNPDWKGKITIRPDGSFARGIGDGGKWRLTNQNGQAALELNWEKWDTQVLSMISPDLFLGKVRRGTFELRRIQTTSTAEEKPQPEKEWLEEYQAPALRSG
jgi:hypothetical protein